MWTAYVLYVDGRPQGDLLTGCAKEGGGEEERSMDVGDGGAASSGKGR